MLFALLMILSGALISLGAYQAILKWRDISSAFAALGVLWAACGITMLAAALTIFISAGLRRVALWAGGMGAVAAGLSLVAGVLTYVVPCSGQS